MHSANISMTILKICLASAQEIRRILDSHMSSSLYRKKVWISDFCFVKRGFVRCKFFDTARFQKRREAVAIVTYVVYCKVEPLLLFTAAHLRTQFCCFVGIEF